MKQYVARFIGEDSGTARHLDHVTTPVPKNSARYALDSSRDIVQDHTALWLTRVRTQCQQAVVALVGNVIHHCAASVCVVAAKMFWEIAGAYGICPKVR